MSILKINTNPILIDTILKNIGCKSTHSICQDEMQTQFEITIDDQKLTIYDSINLVKLNTDFNSVKMQQQISKHASKFMLVTAVVGKSKEKLNILDMSAGLAKDSFILAANGNNVTAIEQNPYVFVVSADAINRAKQNKKTKEIASRIKVILGSSLEYLKTVNKNEFDVIYFDPMFPKRKKTAKVKQDMQVLHEIAAPTPDMDSDILRYIIENKITKKVVIKRPANGPTINISKPTTQIKGKCNRFDIYALS